MDRFLAMQTFVRAARSRSFTRTAAQLGISRSLVTRHIAALEQSLGVTLFNRSTRSVLLTEDGASYLQSCERILLDVESAERALTQGRGKPTGTLSITAPKSFGTLHLADAIIDFAKAQPDIRVSLTLGDFTFRAQDFVSSGHDVATRTVDIRDSSIIARRIGTFQFVLCATPLYIAEMEFHRATGRHHREDQRRLSLQFEPRPAQGHSCPSRHWAPATLLCRRRSGIGGARRSAAGLSTAGSSNPRCLSTWRGTTCESAGIRCFSGKMVRATARMGAAEGAHQGQSP